MFSLSSPPLLLPDFLHSPLHKGRLQKMELENAMSEFHWKFAVGETFCLDQASFVESLVANHRPYLVFKEQ